MPKTTCHTLSFLLDVLQGLLSKVLDLQLTLLSVRSVEMDVPAQRGRKGQTEGEYICLSVF